MSFVFSEEMLSAYLDGELTPDEVAQMDRFLEDHPEQRELLAELTEVKRAVTSLPRVVAPKDFAEEVLSRLPQAHVLSQPLSEVRQRRMVGFSRLAVAVCALVVVGFILVQSPHPNRQADIALNASSDAAAEADFGVFEMEMPGAQQTAAVPEIAAMALTDEMGNAASGMFDDSASPVPSVTFLEREQLRQKLNLLGETPKSGEQLSVLVSRNDVPILVDFTVVDVQSSLSKLRLLLRQHATTPVVVEGANQAEGNEGSGELVAVMIEMAEPEMENVLRQVSAVDAQLYSTFDWDPVNEFPLNAEAMNQPRSADLVSPINSEVESQQDFGADRQIRGGERGIPQYYDFDFEYLKALQAENEMEARRSGETEQMEPADSLLQESPSAKAEAKQVDSSGDGESPQRSAVGGAAGRSPPGSVSEAVAKSRVGIDAAPRPAAAMRTAPDATSKSESSVKSDPAPRESKSATSDPGLRMNAPATEAGSPPKPDSRRLRAIVLLRKNQVDSQSTPQQ